MAESKEKKAKPAPKKEATESKAKEKEERKAEKVSNSRVAAVGVIVALAVLVIVVLFVLVPNVSGVSFQTFKINFNAAPRVALVVTFPSQPEFVNTSQCYTSMLEIIGRTRNASTIDLYLVNQTTCTYSASGLGGNVNVKTTAPSTCLATADSEPSIFLNYSATNYTQVTPDHLYIGANNAYLASCPIAAELG